jgi:hypothetical protein
MHLSQAIVFTTKQHAEAIASKRGLVVRILGWLGLQWDAFQLFH